MQTWMAPCALHIPRLQSMQVAACSSIAKHKIVTDCRLPTIPVITTTTTLLGSDSGNSWWQVSPVEHTCDQPQTKPASQTPAAARGLSLHYSQWHEPGAWQCMTAAAPVVGRGGAAGSGGHSCTRGSSLSLPVLQVAHVAVAGHSDSACEWQPIRDTPRLLHTSPSPRE